MVDGSVAGEVEKGTPVLPRVLGELADVVDKISGAELPLTHGQMWALIGVMAAGIGVEERFRTIASIMPKEGIPSWSEDNVEELVTWVRESLEYGSLSENLDPVSVAVLKGQIDLFKEMVAQKDFGAALAVAGGAAMAVMGGLSKHANEPIRVSEGFLRLPGLGEIVSRQLRAAAKVVGKEKV